MKHILYLSNAIHQGTEFFAYRVLAFSLFDSWHYVGEVENHKHMYEVYFDAPRSYEVFIEIREDWVKKGLVEIKIVNT